ncbi:gamma-glutamyl-gamma-aminobutyrate hydrolase [Campylobacter sp. MIT 12-8780]|uniref:gamma-glutamyl-gamma-aminobutyrate hydrolase family protein n=1 Tax=unclassified Campylobacter TaxID=2593542 RepID=UPI00115DB306|nr:MULTISPECIES: gamma-glutamyl-gamma-aminobutyrate hydrolase family protein [unclassified Campylobacter]NDJ27741.1 gamma-glutamyl-gamma-aminobutyrate hydrolase family protein [Campylobacter sp. MIT 19-121]TQR41051.1 gamma-glutamyl-gamma-aminobutyrate hydrolase [Campylobacter sp. MIT 12-8780]
MIIGISASVLKLKKEIFKKKYYLNVAYVDKLLKCEEKNLGVFIIPFCEKEAIKSLLANTNGVILSGGFDIHPKFYKQSSKPLLEEVCKKRDEFEFRLIEEAMKQELPIFGICRGMQTLNVFFGGTLHQDLSYEKISVLKHRQKQKPSLATHRVDILENSFLSNFLPSKIKVNSFHHQGIDTLAKDFKISAKSGLVIEAIEYQKSKNLVFGVQWHPEAMKDKHSRAIFQAFVNECKKGKK